MTLELWEETGGISDQMVEMWMLLADLRLTTMKMSHTLLENTRKVTCTVNGKELG